LEAYYRTSYGVPRTQDKHTPDGSAIGRKSGGGKLFVTAPVLGIVDFKLAREETRIGDLIMASCLKDDCEMCLGEHEMIGLELGLLDCEGNWKTT
jgi:hypothetical protein